MWVIALRNCSVQCAIETAYCETIYCIRCITHRPNTDHQTRQLLDTIHTTLHTPALCLSAAVKKQPTTHRWWGCRLLGNDCSLTGSISTTSPRLLNQNGDRVKRCTRLDTNQSLTTVSDNNVLKQEVITSSHGPRQLPWRAADRWEEQLLSVVRWFATISLGGNSWPLRNVVSA